MMTLQKCWNCTAGGMMVAGTAAHLAVVGTSQLLCFAQLGQSCITNRVMTSADGCYGLQF
jgi:hypothetical protein